MDSTSVQALNAIKQVRNGVLPDEASISIARLILRSKPQAFKRFTALLQPLMLADKAGRNSSFTMTAQSRERCSDAVVDYMKHGETTARYMDFGERPTELLHWIMAVTTDDNHRKTIAAILVQRELHRSVTAASL